MTTTAIGKQLVAPHAYHRDGSAVRQPGRSLTAKHVLWCAATSGVAWGCWVAQVALWLGVHVLVRVARAVPILQPVARPVVWASGLLIQCLSLGKAPASLPALWAHLAHAARFVAMSALGAAAGWVHSSRPMARCDSYAYSAPPAWWDVQLPGAPTRFVDRSSGSLW